MKSCGTRHSLAVKRGIARLRANSTDEQWAAIHRRAAISRAKRRSRYVGVNRAMCKLLGLIEAPTLEPNFVEEQLQKVFMRGYVCALRDANRMRIKQEEASYAESMHKMNRRELATISSAWHTAIKNP